MTARVIETIDTHTLGEPTRIVLSGFPALRGRTQKERSRDLLARHSDLRRALMWEPRGHNVMFGAIVTPPSVPGADLGLVFMDGGGAVDMCVHGTIGAVTALVESGRLKVPRGRKVLIDTPAAPVQARVSTFRGRVSGVDLDGVASRSVASGLRAHVNGRDVPYDLAYGGNLVALVDGRDAHVVLRPEAFATLVETGMAIKRQVERGAPDVVSAVLYSRIAPRRYRDLVVFREHSVDRSPCGTCFAALMAQLYSTKRLRLDEWIECENLLGLAFAGRLSDRGGRLIPQLRGRAFITGEHRFRIDSSDPLRHGFQLS